MKEKFKADGNPTAFRRPTIFFRSSLYLKEGRENILKSMREQKNRQLRRRLAGDVDIKLEHDFNVQFEKLYDMKKKVTSKLLYDSRKVEQLTLNLNLAQEKISGMLKVFDAFEKRLTNLEPASGSLYLEAHTMSTTIRNLEEADRAFAKLLSHFSVYNETKDILKDPHRFTNDSELFLKSLEKALNSRRYFEDHPLKSAEESLSLLNSLCAAGLLGVQRAFKTLCKSSSFSVNLPPPEAGLEAELESLSTLRIPESVAEELHQMSEFLHEKANDTEHCTVYEKSRSDALVYTLLTISRGGSEHSSASADKAKKDDKAKKKSIIFFEFESSKLYEKGSHPFVMLISIFSHMIVQEHDQWLRIMGPRKGSFEGALSQALEVFVNTGEFLVRMANGDMERKEFFLFLPLLDVVSQLKSPSFDFIKERVKQSYNQIDRLIETYTTTCLRYLHEYFAEVKKGTHKPVSDGTVHSLTVKVLSFIPRLLEYKSALESFVHRFNRVTDESENKLSELVEVLVNELRSQLFLLADYCSQKAGDDAINHIFLINNFNYIQKAIVTGGIREQLGSKTLLQDFYDLLQQDILKRFDFYKETYLVLLTSSPKQNLLNIKKIRLRRATRVSIQSLKL
ncbi:exocyst complex component 7-like isoform X2 [Zophobas morio]|uniref:exocyst complex component 7-like isoform X2 n=1 Tax=Zophobas morio TaxID=2755281 RepID=UPI003082C849